jgi:hypothetical protein
MAPSSSRGNVLIFLFAMLDSAAAIMPRVARAACSLAPQAGQTINA